LADLKYSRKLNFSSTEVPSGPLGNIYYAIAVAVVIHKSWEAAPFFGSSVSEAGFKWKCI
jgi:hypothetical protein